MCLFDLRPALVCRFALHGFQEKTGHIILDVAVLESLPLQHLKQNTHQNP